MANVHRSPLLIALLLAACGGPSPAPAPTPVPGVAAAAPEPGPAPVVLAIPLAPDPADTTVTGPAEGAAVAPTADERDQAADEAALDRLAQARGGADSASADAGDLPESVTWDIDVSTFADHDRVQYYLDFFQAEGRERMAIWLTRLPKYEAMIRARLQREALPEDLVYLALIESGFSNTAVSRSKAVGMWQFMKGTARLYGLRVDPWVDERRDPFLATDAAARLLADLRNQFGGSLYLAAAAYNAGAGRVRRGLRRLPDGEEVDDSGDATYFRLADTRFLRRETRDYVPKLIAAALIAKRPEAYGFAPLPAAVPLVMDSILVPDATGFDVIARLADTTLAAIRELNPHFLRLATPPGRAIVVRLPAGAGPAVATAYEALPVSKRITFREHFVAPGETLGHIALRYRVSVDEIRAANRQVRPTALRPGQRLIIPTAGIVPPREAYRMEAAGRGAERPRSAPGGIYRVRSGESLWTIARAFGVTVDQLRAWNGLADGEVLQAGRKIRVSAPAERGEAPATPGSGATTTHLVRPGDTLSGIALRYAVSENELRRANGLDAGSVIRVGERLKIPAGES